MNVIGLIFEPSASVPFNGRTAFENRRKTSKNFFETKGLKFIKSVMVKEV